MADVVQQCENTKLAGEFSSKCGHRPKQGILKKWYGNTEDIDREATILANKGTKITTLVLKEGAVLHEAYGNDKTNKVNHALSVGDFLNGYTHTDSYSVLYDGENTRERVQELADGARVFTIVKKVDGGVAGELTYEVAGFESGMLITEDAKSSAENSGVRTVSCATKKGEEESTGLKLFLLSGGLTATETWITQNTYGYTPPTP